MGANLQDDYAYAQKVRAQLAKLAFLRDLQYAQETELPHGRYQYRPRRAPDSSASPWPTLSARWSPPLPRRASPNPTYWRDPVSGNGFQIQVQLPQNRMQSIDAVGASLRWCDGRRAAATLRYCDPGTGHDAGPHRALQRTARGQPDRQPARHRARGCRGTDRARFARRRDAAQERQRANPRRDSAL